MEMSEEKENFIFFFRTNEIILRYNGSMRPSITTSITKIQKQIIVGNILGDGCLEYNGFYGTRLQIKQAERYKEYVFWFYSALKNLYSSLPKQRKDNSQWYFSTRYLIELTDFQRCFYSNGKKVIPKNITNLFISPLTLAVWYMDDGTLDYRPKDHFAFSLTTHSFSTRDTYRLVQTLKKNFGIESMVFNNLIRGKRYPRLYIGAKGREKFLHLVKPYILDCFKHKLPPL